MSLQDKNSMLIILHKQRVSRKNIKIIMIDLNKSGIFDDVYDSSSDLEWEIEDRKAEVLFSNLSFNEKLKAIKIIEEDSQEKEEQRRLEISQNAERRIQQKILEMEKLGITSSRKKKNKENKSFTIKYGRTPLHQAISVRNVPLITRYIKKGLYIDCVDNNNHTPMEMAYYGGYTAIYKIFKKYQNKK